MPSGGDYQVDDVSLPIKFELVQGQTGQIAPCISVNLDSVQIYRLLDPEFQESFISIGRLFLAHRLTFIQGLEQFSLRLPSYSFDVSGLAPFTDIWIPLDKARGIVRKLECDKQLAGFLATKSAWSLVDRSAQELVHNWRIPEETLAATQYSTETISQTSFQVMHALGPGRQITTQFSQSASTKLDRRSQLLSRLARWSCDAYEESLDGEKTDRAIDASSSDLIKCIRGLAAWHEPDSTAVDKGFAKEATSTEVADLCCHLLLILLDRSNGRRAAAPESTALEQVDNTDSRLRNIESSLAATVSQLQHLTTREMAPTLTPQQIQICVACFLLLLAVNLVSR